MKQPNTDTAVFAEVTSKATSAIAPGEIIIGIVASIDSQGRPLVNYPDNQSASDLIAMSTLGITAAHIGREVALLFANGDSQRPVIMGLIHSTQSALHDLILAYDPAAVERSDLANDDAPATQSKTDDITVDGKRVVLEGKEEVVLRCGEASITLTKAGKILIRGNYLLNRSSGVNRIMGGSVQVN